MAAGSTPNASSRKHANAGSSDKNASLDRDSIHALIMQPGFSTAETVSDISGRGVGMDVVRRNVEAINGHIAITSELGAGTTFNIRLPLTLAILDALTVSIGTGKYLLPLPSIVEIVRPREEDLHSVMGRGELIAVRGEDVPVIRVAEVLEPGADVSGDDTLVVIVEHEGHRVGLLVDRLLGKGQVVVKSLETHWHRVSGLLGATILGDGTVAFILDVQGVVRLASRRDGHDGVAKEADLQELDR